MVPWEERMELHHTERQMCVAVVEFRMTYGSGAEELVHSRVLTKPRGYGLPKSRSLEILGTSLKVS